MSTPEPLPAVVLRYHPTAFERAHMSKVPNLGRLIEDDSLDPGQVMFELRDNGILVKKCELSESGFE